MCCSLVGWLASWLSLSMLTKLACELLIHYLISCLNLECERECCDRELSLDTTFVLQNLVFTRSFEVPDSTFPIIARIEMGEHKSFFANDSQHDQSRVILAFAYQFRCHFQWCIVDAESGDTTKCTFEPTLRSHSLETSIKQPHFTCTSEGIACRTLSMKPSLFEMASIDSVVSCFRLRCQRARKIWCCLARFLCRSSMALRCSTTRMRRPLHSLVQAVLLQAPIRSCCPPVSVRYSLSFWLIACCRCRAVGWHRSRDSKHRVRSAAAMQLR